MLSMLVALLGALFFGMVGVTPPVGGGEDEGVISPPIALVMSSPVVTVDSYTHPELGNLTFGEAQLFKSHDEYQTWLATLPEAARDEVNASSAGDAGEGLRVVGVRPLCGFKSQLLWVESGHEFIYSYSVDDHADPQCRPEPGLVVEVFRVEDHFVLAQRDDLTIRARND